VLTSTFLIVAFTFAMKWETLTHCQKEACGNFLENLMLCEYKNGSLSDPDNLLEDVRYHYRQLIPVKHKEILNSYLGLKRKGKTNKTTFIKKFAIELLCLVSDIPDAPVSALLREARKRQKVEDFETWPPH
jgi:hypothetical protein